MSDLMESNWISRSVSAFNLALGTMLADTEDENPPSHRSATGTIFHQPFQVSCAYPLLIRCQNSKGFVAVWNLKPYQWTVYFITLESVSLSCTSNGSSTEAQLCNIMHRSLGKYWFTELYGLPKRSLLRIINSVTFINTDIRNIFKHRQAVRISMA